MKLSQRAFTLVEVMLVAALMSLVVVALYHCLNNGLKLWSHSQRLSIKEDIALFFDRFSEDARSTFYFQQIPFEGKMDRVEFVKVLDVEPDKNGSQSEEELVEQIGRVQYRFDPVDKALFKREANYSQALKKQYASKRILVEAIDQIRFYYYFPQEGKYRVASSAAGEVPSGIEVVVAFTDEYGANEMKHFVNIPVGL